MSRPRPAVLVATAFVAALAGTAGCSSHAMTTAGGGHPSSPAAAPTSGTPTSSASPPAGTPRCHTSDLSAKFAGGQGFSGGGSQNLVLTNVSSHGCTLHGNPGMQLIDNAGHDLPTTVKWVGAKTTVTLQPQQSGYVNVTAWQVPSADDTGAPCDPPAGGVEVTPPDETAQLKIMGTTPPQPMNA